MLTIYRLKPLFQKLLRPVMFWLAGHNVTANHVTIIAILVSLITGIILTIFPNPHLFFLLPIILFIRMALNALDGMLARECHQQSDLGMILNETGDVISDTVLYFPFLFLTNSNDVLVFLMILGAVLTEFCGVLVQTVNQARNYAGPMGKSDRAFVLGTWGLIISIWPRAVFLNNVIYCIVTALLVLTIINRCRSGLSEKQK